MRMRWINVVSIFILPFVSAAATNRANAQLEPDKKVFSVGKWTISTARYGVGCVAHLDDAGLSISGDTFDKLTLLMEVSSNKFRTKLDGSEDDISGIEIALANNRWGNVRPWGYRGTPGVVLDLDTSFLPSFISSKKIKVTERGYEKISIDLSRPEEVIAKLKMCFNSQ